MSETNTAGWNFVDFVSGNTPLPEPNLAWNTYGKGIESIGREGSPEPVEIPESLLLALPITGVCVQRESRLDIALQLLE